MKDSVWHYVEYDSIQHCYVPRVPQLGLFIPSINVVDYKLRNRSIEFNCYVSHQLIFGTPELNENYELKETFYRKGYTVVECDEMIINNQRRYVPVTTLAKDTASFILTANKTSNKYIVLYLQELSVGRIYKVPRIYKEYLTMDRP